MLYVDFKAGSQEYKLRLNIRSTVTLEKQLGANPLTIFGNEQQRRIPTVTEMIYILHAALQQYHHGITLDKTYQIFDDYLADGNNVTEFVSVIFELYQVSGLIPTINEETEKN